MCIKFSMVALFNKGLQTIGEPSLGLPKGGPGCLIEVTV